jgi:hypothetical protein
MDLKIKEALSFFIVVAFISIAAGGDYYYSEMNRTKCSVVRKKDSKHNMITYPGVTQAIIRHAKTDSDTLRLSTADFLQ